MSLVRGIASGRDVAHGAGHLVEPALGELLAQLVGELLELLRASVRREVVLLELLDHAGQVGREQVELHAAARPLPRR